DAVARITSAPPNRSAPAVSRSVFISVTSARDSRLRRFRISANPPACQKCHVAQGQWLLDLIAPPGYKRPPGAAGRMRVRAAPACFEGSTDASRLAWPGQHRQPPVDAVALRTPARRPERPGHQLFHVAELQRRSLPGPAGPSHARRCLAAPLLR